GSGTPSEARSEALLRPVESASLFALAMDPTARLAFSSARSATVSIAVTTSGCRVTARASRTSSRGPLERLGCDVDEGHFLARPLAAMAAGPSIRCRAQLIFRVWVV